MLQSTRIWIYRLSTMIITLGVIPSVFAQTPWQKIERAETALREDKKNNLHVLSPNTHRWSVDILNKAKKQYAKDGNVNELQKQLETFTQVRNTARFHANKAREAIPGVIKARTDALRRKASKTATKSFNDGEKEFADLIKKIEKGKRSDAIKKALDVERLYRDAELRAIKFNLLNGARQVMIHAKEANAQDYAPVTYARADSLIKATESFLDRNRYSKKQASKLAQAAHYQARLSIYLTQLAQSAREEKAGFETHFLNTSDQVARVARSLGVDDQFDAGYEKLVSDMLEAVKNLKLGPENISSSK